MGLGCTGPLYTHINNFTRGAVVLQYFSSKRHKNDRLNMQQLIFKEKPNFERKKLSMVIVMGEFKPI